MTSTDLLLAEELLLLVLDDEKGHDKTMSADTGLAGALLLDLAAGGWVEDVDGKLVAAAAPPAGAPPAEVLADALALIQESDKPRNAGHWVGKLPGKLKPIKGRVAARLVERGVLTEERHKMLGLFGVDRWPEADPEPERTLRERLRAELAGSGEISERTELLAPLLRAMDLVGKVVAKDERKVAKRRAKEIADDPTHIGSAVQSTVNATQAAVMTAVIASTTAATISA
jgi:golgi phosphoprotein 3